MAGNDREVPQQRTSELAHAAALRLLEVRARTQSELERALARKGCPPEVVDAVVARLASVGLVDDRAFARMWVEQRAGGQARGRRALWSELHRKGVQRAVIEEALAAVDEDVEREAARKLCERRARGMSGVAPEVARRRLLALLARRGYSESLAREVVSDTVVRSQL